MITSEKNVWRACSNLLLAIAHSQDKKLLDVDILDCDVALCRESDFPEDATKKYYFTIRKPNPENKDKPFQVSRQSLVIRDSHSVVFFLCDEFCQETSMGFYDSSQMCE